MPINTFSQEELLDSPEDAKLAIQTVLLVLLFAGNVIKVDFLGLDDYLVCLEQSEPPSDALPHVSNLEGLVYLLLLDLLQYFLLYY